MSTRRDFVKTGTVAGGALLAAGVPALARAAVDLAVGSTGRKAAPMSILIFGGTGYIGPHLVRHAVSRGHKVTIFSRGRTDADLPSSVERLIGDRTINDTIPRGNLQSLEGRRFDAVIDDPAIDPRWVRQATELLKTSGRYLFVSSTGVYLPYRTENADETAPTPLMPEDGGPAQYGNQKAQAERVVLEAFGDRGTVVRPAYIVGPGDMSDRFPYWPQRLVRGGETLAPGRKTDRIAIVDVRDLVEFMVKLVEGNRGGVYNVCGPREPMGFERFLTEAQAALNTSAQFTWIEDYDFLRENRVGGAVPWIRLDGDNLYHTVLSNKKAVGAGLSFRPLATSVRDTLAWWPERLKALEPGQQPRFWITPEREQQLLATWKARNAGGDGTR